MVHNMLQRVVVPPRLERGTYDLEDRCSILLSYGTNSLTYFLPMKQHGHRFLLPMLVVVEDSNQQQVLLQMILLTLTSFSPFVKQILRKMLR